MWPTLVFRTLHRIALLTSNTWKQWIKHVIYQVQVSLYLTSLQICYKTLFFQVEGHEVQWLWAPPPAHSLMAPVMIWSEKLGRGSFGASQSKSHMHSALLSATVIAPLNTVIMGDASSWPAVPVTRGKNWFHWWMVSTENKKRDLKVENYSLLGGLPEDLSPWHSLSDCSKEVKEEPVFATKTR